MNNLQELRKKALLSQNELVELSGVSRSLVTKYESGEKDINKAAGATLYKLAIALGCNMENLLENMEVVKMDILQNQYNAWRKAGADAIEGTDMNFTWDCGESAAREDFSNFANLQENIEFEEMIELERNYTEV